MDRLKLEPVTAVQLYEQIVARLAAQIQAGGWKPGDRLPSERDLSRQLGVSRPSLREALGALEVKGVIKTRHGLGNFVADNALDLLPNVASPAYAGADISPAALLEVRETIDPATARLAAQQHNHPGRIRAEELLALMDANLDPSIPEQRSTWSDADRLFHRQIGAMTGNPIFITVCDYIATVMDQPLWRRLRDEAISPPGRIQEFAHEHRAIFEAIVEGDSEASGLLAARHVRRVRKQMSLD